MEKNVSLSAASFGEIKALIGQNRVLIAVCAELEILYQSDTSFCRESIRRQYAEIIAEGNPRPRAVLIRIFIAHIQAIREGQKPGANHCD